MAIETQGGRHRAPDSASHDTEQRRHRPDAPYVTHARDLQQVFVGPSLHGEKATVFIKDKPERLYPSKESPRMSVLEPVLREPVSFVPKTPDTQLPTEINPPKKTETYTLPVTQAVRPIDTRGMGVVTLFGKKTAENTWRVNMDTIRAMARGDMPVAQGYEAIVAAYKNGDKKVAKDLFKRNYTDQISA